MTKKFATAINCMDGRTQGPVSEYMRNNFGVDYTDMITEPGPNKILSEAKDLDIIESLKKKVEISVKSHGSEVIVIAAHHDCLGNAQSDDVQKEQLHKAAGVVASWGFPVKRIVVLWLDESFRPAL